MHLNSWVCACVVVFHQLSLYLLLFTNTYSFQNSNTYIHVQIHSKASNRHRKVKQISSIFYLTHINLVVLLLYFPFIYPFTVIKYLFLMSKNRTFAYGLKIIVFQSVKSDISFFFSAVKFIWHNKILINTMKTFIYKTCT